MNKAILIGNLGKDPEVKQLDGGSKLAKFSIATSNKYKNKAGETVTETTWHSIIVWGKLADVVEKYLKKGDKVCVRGRIDNRSYTDKEGVKRYTTEINCDELEFLTTKPAANNQQQQTTTSNQQPQNLGEQNDDLPF